MGLFGFGTKRKPAAKQAVSRPKSGFDTLRGTSPRPRDRHNMPNAGRHADPQTGVEVSEFSLDEDDFSTMFGETSQFADAAFEREDPADPWSSKLRLD